MNIEEPSQFSSTDNQTTNHEKAISVLVNLGMSPNSNIYKTLTKCPIVSIKKEGYIITIDYSDREPVTVEMIPTVITNPVDGIGTEKMSFKLVSDSDLFIYDGYEDIEIGKEEEEKRRIRYEKIMEIFKNDLFSLDELKIALGKEDEYPLIDNLEEFLDLLFDHDFLILNNEKYSFVKSKQIENNKQKIARQIAYGRSNVTSIPKTMIWNRTGVE